MRICFYAPFKPLDHPHPSGDLVIARGLFAHLQRQGHSLEIASRLRCRWIYRRPWLWPPLLREGLACRRRQVRQRCDLWLTYHTYYKAPDVLGPWVCRYNRLPYVIFQGIYATKRRKDWRTWPGFMLNRYALLQARHVFTNKKVDLLNLKRLLPSSRITYLAPGIDPDEFQFSPTARVELRRKWQVGETPVVLTAAMFRADVKTRGLKIVIETCGRLRRQGRRLFLVIAGEGKTRLELERLAADQLPGCYRFVGQIDRDQMHTYYSAADAFVFPGIRESLGMVFLEAQSCGLPVVAYANGGIAEVVDDGCTGLLAPLYDQERLTEATGALLADETLRRDMGTRARRYIRRHHDLAVNYRRLGTILHNVKQGSDH